MGGYIVACGQQKQTYNGAGDQTEVVDLVSWLEIDAVYKLGNYTLVSTTLCLQSDDLDKQPSTVTSLAM